MKDKSADMTDRYNAVAQGMMMLAAYCPRQITWEDKQGKRCRLPLTQIHLMMLLRKEDLPITVISNRMHMAKPNITPMVDRLESSGYVRRIRDTADHRIVRVHLDKRGAACLKQIEKILLTRFQNLCEAYSEEEQEEILRAVERTADFALSALER